MAIFFIVPTCTALLGLGAMIICPSRMHDVFNTGTDAHT